MGKFKLKKYLLVFLTVGTVFFVILNTQQLEREFIPSTASKENIFHNLSKLSNVFEDFISHRIDWESPNSDFYFFEKLASDEIGAFRELPDTRDEVCKKRVYDIPRNSKVSVIIVYRNEVRSTLLRGIASLIQRTPAKFLHEIVVIDDFSHDESSIVEMGQLPLGPFVKLHRNRRHYGLIESRNLGAKIATGDYIAFLDSHCEVNVGWIEPLLDRLASYHGMAVSPILDSIDATTFQYHASSKYLKGGFSWNLHFRWIPMREEEREAKADPSDPFTSPAFAGGVFMISRNWFFKLDGFNPLLEIWGGESIEMSIKLWLCGGQIEIVPCSRVGHVFRKTNHSLDLPNGLSLRNRKIIAESWLDEHKYFFYSTVNPASIASYANKNGTPSSVERMKKDLQCRPFAWYLQTVFHELKVPNVDYIAFGKLSSGQRCLKIVSAASGALDVRLKNCYHGHVTHWFLDAKDGRLRSDTGVCLNVVGRLADKARTGTPTVALQYCKSKRRKSQSWTRLGGKLIHDNTHLCLDNPLSEVVTMSKCRRGAPSQLFSFSVELQLQ